MDPEPGGTAENPLDQNSMYRNIAEPEGASNWLTKIKSKLPEGSLLVATVRRSEKNDFIASYRAQCGEETFISEVRDSSSERAVDEAGRNLYNRLLSDSGVQPSLRDKFRNLFLDAA